MTVLPLPPCRRSKPELRDCGPSAEALAETGRVGIRRAIFGNEFPKTQPPYY
jgi:hypothetical protein